MNFVGLFALSKRDVLYSVREIPPRIRHQFSVVYEKSDSDTVYQSKLRRFVKIFQKSKYGSISCL